MNDVDMVRKFISDAQVACNDCIKAINKAKRHRFWFLLANVIVYELLIAWSFYQLRYWGALFNFGLLVGLVIFNWCIWDKTIQRRRELKMIYAAHKLKLEKALADYLGYQEGRSE